MIAFKRVSFLLLLLVCVQGHSWVSCTNYDRSNGDDDEVYNGAKCTGWGRGWGSRCQYTNTQFGLDCGYDYRGNGNTGFCSSSLISGNYSAGYTAGSPMATYSAGQTVCLAWPAKNHVAASCANPNIPDSGTKIYMSGANPTSDPSGVAALSSSPYTLVKDLGRNTAANQKVGFQNCPRFCEDNDKCLCTGCFNIPSNVQQGSTYSFYWVWAFNSADDLYISCWEAKIAGTATPAQTSATSNSPTSASTARTSASTLTSRSTSTSASTSTSRSTSTSASTARTSASTSTSRSTSTSNSATQVTPVSSTAITGNCGDEVSTCKEVCKEATILKCSCEGGNLNVECDANAIQQDSSSSILSFFFTLYLFLL